MRSSQSQPQSFYAPPSAGDSVPPPYLPLPGVFDEMMDASGRVRPHWQTFQQWLAQATHGELEGRMASVRQLLRDHGVTYNIYDDAVGTSRPWELDLIPLVIDENEWLNVAAGLQQRGTLLNELVADIYGPQRVLKEGLLPPALLYGNPSFLRAVMGVQPSGPFLFSIAHDLVRGPDGQWMVLADRTQTPYGQGYTLENRVIMANVHADEFGSSHVRRLGSYFDNELNALQSMAPHRKGDSGILMLAPSPTSEAYFEVAYKARQMGFPLVEGADLTVRDRRLHLKTLEGLVPADVVMRHVIDSQCDPLELDRGGSQGTAGFLEAWRTGSVALANGLGSAVVETPALNPFLPGLCRALLGENLKMPGLPTWWCGQQRELQMVLKNPDRWVLKSTFHRGGKMPVFVANLSAEDKATLLDEVRAHPHDWIAQEMHPLSTTPAWTGEKLEPRPLVWRAFAFAAGSNRVVMPGGLARVSPETSNWIVTMRTGGSSKDVWIVGQSHVDESPLQQRAPIIIRPTRPPSSVPSRAADHLYWLGRYAERTEQTARILRSILSRLTGERISGRREDLNNSVGLMDHISLPTIPNATVHSRVHALLSAPHLVGNIPYLINRLVFNAAAARDRLSDDTWRLINRIQSDSKFTESRLVVSTSLEKLHTLILDLAAFCGMQLESTTRGHGWRFLEIGRRIERAQLSALLIGGTTQHIKDRPGSLDPLLEVCDSTMTFRRLHYAQPTLEPVLDLLLLNVTNPRSVAFQLKALRTQAEQLPTSASISPEMECEQTIDMEAELDSLNLLELSRARQGTIETVHELCLSLDSRLDVLSRRITEHYFSHATRRVK